MRYTYCPDCGRKLGEIRCGDDGMVPWCEACQKRWFDSFYSCVIVMTYNELGEIVLCRQNYLSTRYDTVTSGYITPGETAEEAARREVREELGIELESLEYAGTYWFVPGQQLMHAFLGFARRQPLHPSEEVDAAAWVPLAEAPKTMFPDLPGNAIHPMYRMLAARLGVQPADGNHA